MEVTIYLRFFLVLMVVLGLIFGLGWLLKRIGIGDGARGPLARRRRLGTIESATLDARHKIVLVRRDDVEHLVLVGPNTSQVVESGIPANGEIPTENQSSPISFARLLSGNK
jgi:flagellar protein FliO/FliZ